MCRDVRLFGFEREIGLKNSFILMARIKAGNRVLDIRAKNESWRANDSKLMVAKMSKKC